MNNATRERPLRLIARGLVQGVGFRPFVARLARALELTGEVANTGRGVEITLFGPVAKKEEFAHRLTDDAPPMALVMEVEREELAPCAEPPKSFTIAASRREEASAVIIPPDIATCSACVEELLTPEDRRRGYPFINCTDCGPRYTIIEGVPYDRPHTSMKGFELCDKCRDEYEDQGDRRYHAQPNACPECGPRLKALDETGSTIEGAPLALAAGLLGDAKTVALLGVGGFHLACDARSQQAVERLRLRKARPAKPFAVMVADLDEARKIAVIDDRIATILTSPAAPIVLCPAREGSGLVPSVAPAQQLVGVFLPYTPLHYLVFDMMKALGGPRALVMTSGNRSDEPIISSEEQALEKLGVVADLFLVHDRPIIHPVDDSVVKCCDDLLQDVMVRRARGYAPRPLALAAAKRAGLPVTLCLGAELCNTVTVVRDGFAFVGPHVGDLKNLDTESAYREGAHHLLELLQVRPELVVADRHPAYRSTAFAEVWRAGGVAVLQVQHHEAHAAACMAEHGFEGEALALTLDGVGLGHDGTIWGGELLAGRPGSFQRAAHLKPVPQPGGDAAAKEPWRMAAAHLRAALGGAWKDSKFPAFTGREPDELALLDQMMERGLNCPPTSSCGRLFDAAAALLGFSGAMLYSAQAPMELEALAERAGGVERILENPMPAFDLKEGQGITTLDPAPVVRQLAEAGRGPEESRALAALAFHEALARSWAEVVEASSGRLGLKEVFLSGGCMVNSVLAGYLKRMLEARGLKVYLHRQLPPGDGSISFGQGAWAALSRL